MEIKAPSTKHATCVDIKGSGVLIVGDSGSGKSGLAIGLIALGASLVADDQCEISIKNDKLHVSKPKSLPKCIEMRGIGLVSVPTVLRTQLKWVVDMDRVAEERMPEFKFTDISGHRVPTIFAKNMDDLAFRIYVVACNELSEF